jgi:hypothetical protein
MEDVTHKQILDRLIEVEVKVDQLDLKTGQVVKAFDAASGAFIVLDWIGKAAKPILWIIGVGAAIIAIYEKYSR